MTAALAILLALLVLPDAASAQAVYRCGNTFSERHCGPDAKVIVAPPAQPATAAPVEVKLEAPPYAPPPPAEQIDANRATCETKTRAAMKDPESTRIKSVSRSGVALQRLAGRAFYGVSYHMNVNAKNSYGGYTGEKLYNCVFALDEKTYLGSQELAPWPN